MPTDCTLPPLPAARFSLQLSTDAVVQAYSSSKRRLFLLGYNATLTTK